MKSENMNYEPIKIDLSSSKIGDRRKAIKLIVKNGITDLASDLFKLYLVEKEKNKSWEIQCELIRAFGLLNFTPALETIESICMKNLDHDMISMDAAGCFVRLSRKNLSDIAPIKQLFEYAKYSLVYGALDVVAKDKMILSDEDVQYLIKFIDKIPVKRERGYMDIRTGLACACAGWKKSEIVVQFLNECMRSDFTFLTVVAEKALKGKYADLS